MLSYWDEEIIISYRNLSQNKMIFKKLWYYKYVDRKNSRQLNVLKEMNLNKQSFHYKKRPRLCFVIRLLFGLTLTNLCIWLLSCQHIFLRRKPYGKNLSTCLKARNSYISMHLKHLQMIEKICVMKTSNKEHAVYPLFHF